VEWSRSACFFVLLLFLEFLSFTLRVSVPSGPERALATISLSPVLTAGLSSPVYLTNAHDGSDRIFIVEQPGRIQVLQPGASSPTLFLDITSKVQYGGEQGLLGLTFHPRFTANGRFFVDYTRKPDGATVIAEYHVSSSDTNRADDAETMLLTIPQPYSNHNGGMVEFGPDGFLYIGMGDGGSGNDPGNRAQNTQELLGKILRIDVDRQDPGKNYASPPDNPYYGSGIGQDEIYALGLRNPWRFSFDPLTGRLLVGDVGQNEIEEIDSVTRGGNYGWRILEGTQCTNLGPTSCNDTSFVLPIAEYSHQQGRCAITGGYVYRGNGSTLPFGSYVFGDYCSGEIFMLSGETQSVLLKTGLNISSFGEDEMGEVYVVGLGGEVYRISNPDAPSTPSLYFPSLVSTSVPQAGQNEYTGFAIANTGRDEAVVTLTAYGRDGSPIDGAQITNPRSLSLPAGGQIALLDYQIFGPGLSLLNAPGWVKLQSNVGEITSFFLTFSAGLEQMDGADAESNAPGFLLFPEVGSDGATEIHLANPNPGVAQLELSLIGADGQARAAASRSVAGFGSLAESVAGLFPGVTPESSDYIQATSDQGLASFEYIRGNGDTHGLNGQDASAGATVLYAPQYVAGGGYRSTVSVINIDPTRGDAILALMNDDGTPYSIPRQVSLPGHGKIYIDDPEYFGSPGNSRSQGYLTIKSSGRRLAGSVTYSDSQGKTFSASLPLVSTLKRDLVFSQAVSNLTYFTGIALLNPGATDAQVQIELTDAKSGQTLRQTVTLKAGERTSRLLTEYFPSLIGRSMDAGFVHVASDNGVAAYALFGTNSLSVLSAIP
jgi:glucose/arabinose dehydrogenase